MSVNENPSILNSITQFGITWYFDRPLIDIDDPSINPSDEDTYHYGTFANGDYWVVGPVGIVALDPESRSYGDNSIRNGSMLNPSQNSNQGYDSRSNDWDAQYNVGLGISAEQPLIVPTNSSLISTISLPARDDGSWLESAAILTVLASVPAANSFRPPYYGTDKTINYNENMLNYAALSSLSKEGIESIPSLAQESDDENQDASVERMFQRPWIDHIKNWMVRGIHPIKNMYPYGRDLSNQIGIGALMLQLDYTNEQKRNLLVRYVQLGIDLYCIISAGAIDNWPGGGGHCQGRKWPILFAGLVLNEAGMKAIGEKSGDYLYSEKLGGGNYGPGDPPPDYILFQEDLQTWYVTDDDVGRSIRATLCKGFATSASSNTIGVVLPGAGAYAELSDLYLEITSGPGSGQRRYISEETVGRSNNDEPGILTVSENWDVIPVVDESYYEVQGYEYFHVELPEWGINPLATPDKDNPSWDAGYRTLNGYSWPGWILAAHIMGAKELWNHDVLFDYQDRHMQVSGPQGQFPRWHVLDPFTKNVWYAYRADYGPIWPDTVTTEYSKGTNLSSNTDNELTIIFSRYPINVNNIYGTSLTSNKNYTVFLFKNKHTEKNKISIQCRLRSNWAPLYSTVYLQIFNRIITTWENLDSNNIENADENFILSGTITTNLNNYFDANLWISCRIYQKFM